LTQPVQVDSARPIGTRNESKVEAAEPAFARLWDDPFAVYPEENEARLLQPLPRAGGETLYLIVPTKTEQYEEDRENRIRTRYAIQRASIDQGFAAEGSSIAMVADRRRHGARAAVINEGGVIGQDSAAHGVTEEGLLENIRRLQTRQKPRGGR
jgi:hypothetical protein